MFYGCNTQHEEAESSDKQTTVSTEKPKQTIEEFSELSSHEKALLDKLIKVDKQLFIGKTVGSFIKQATIKRYKEHYFNSSCVIQC